MKARRLIVGASMVLGLSLFAVAIDGAISYARYQSASEWPSATAEVLDQVTLVQPPRLRTWMVERDYLVVRYRFSSPAGEVQGETTAPRDSDFYKGALREVRFNPGNPTVSVLADQIDQYRRLALGQSLLGLALALGFLFFAWHVGIRRKLENSLDAL